jgi:hypothetical protein
MTAVFGIVSLLQMAVLPGAAIVYAFRLHRVAPVLPSVFGLSLLFNYLFVALAVLAGIYTRISVEVIIACEILLLVCLFIFRNDFQLTLTQTTAFKSMAAEWTEWRNSRSGRPLRFVLELQLATWAAWVIVRSLIDSVRNAGDGFDTWDSINSWNHWALDWASGKLPVSPYHYAQLIPTNWSLSYVLLQDRALTSFASSLDRFVVAGILYCLFWYAFKCGQYFLVIAVPLCAAVLPRALSYFAFGAGADVPVAFFALLSAVVMLGTRDHDESQKTLFLRNCVGAAFAVACVSTKQAGWMWFVAFTLILVDSARGRPDSYRRSLFGILAVALVIGALWYIYVQFEIATGKQTSEVPWVTGGVHGGRGPAARIAYAFGLLPISIWLLCVPGLFCVADRHYRILFSFGVLVPVVIWALFFSYDTRNLTIAFPLMSLTAVVGSGIVIGAAGRYLNQIEAFQQINIAGVRLGWIFCCFALCVFAALTIAGTRYDRERLLRYQYFREPIALSPPDGAYLAALTKLLNSSGQTGHIITLERYSCLLTLARTVGCDQVQNTGELEERIKTVDMGQNLFVVGPPGLSKKLIGEAAKAKLFHRYSGVEYDVWARTH